LGDTGSLSLGGILAVLAILIREEIFLAIVGGVFVIEALSTISQRYFFKYTRKKTGTGKRIFRCAPLHHHFELLGHTEEKIVIRFLDYCYASRCHRSGYYQDEIISWCVSVYIGKHYSSIFFNKLNIYQIIIN